MFNKLISMITIPQDMHLFGARCAAELEAYEHTEPTSDDQELVEVMGTPQIFVLSDTDWEFVGFTLLRVADRNDIGKIFRTLPDRIRSHETVVYIALMRANRHSFDLLYSLLPQNINDMKFLKDLAERKRVKFMLLNKLAFLNIFAWLQLLVK